MARPLQNARRLLPVLACAALAAGCGPAAEPDTVEFTRLAFGTIVTVEIVTNDEPRAADAMRALDALFARLDHDWYAFGDGELGRVNAALRAGEPVATTAALSALIGRSLDYRQQSDGLFDPVLGELVALWGFADFNARETDPVPPDAAALAAWRSLSAADRQVTVAGRVISAAAPVQLDLGGVAKGAILAQAGALLESLGVSHAMLDLGGDIRVLGRRGTRPWRIAIRDPLSDGVIGVVALDPGESMVSSGNYARAYTAGDARIHHVLDPVTGKPVTGTAGVTVIAADAERADAAATALMVAGPRRFAELAERMGIDQALLIGTDGEHHLTAAMRRRFEPLAGP